MEGKISWYEVLTGYLVDTRWVGKSMVEFAIRIEWMGGGKVGYL